MSIDTGSDTWVTVVRWIEDQRARAQLKLATPGRDLQSTEFHRGRLALLSELAALPREPVQVPTDRPVLLTD
jgi:hypothetical protein